MLANNVKFPLFSSPFIPSSTNDGDDAFCKELNEEEASRKKVVFHKNLFKIFIKKKEIVKGAKTFCS